MDFDINHVNSIAIILFVIKEIYKSMKGKENSHDLALTQNTLALVELREQLKYMNIQFSDLTKRVEHLENK